MTAIHNTLTGTTTIRQLPTIAGQPHPLPEHYIVLEVINNPAPDYNPATHRLTSEYIVNLEELQYVRVWTEVALTAYELAVREWVHPEWAKRIKVMNEPALKMKMANVLTYWDDEGFPRDTHNGYIRLWCNEVLPSHQVFIQTANEWLEQFNEEVHEEDRPKILNPDM